jgi:GrpB-like predicted nucleotidyltransferase (UPF0157 family)
MSEEVVIVDYNPRWPARYEEEKASILALIGEYVVGIHHVGSTSVPGLGAKPIIDVMIGIRDLAFVENCVSPLQSLEYEYLGEYGIPGRHYFRKPAAGGIEHRTHHIHMMQTDHSQWRRHLLFRDYLRSHPEDAKRYEFLKRELAIRFGADREGYTDAKTEFVEDILAKAEAQEVL